MEVKQKRGFSTTRGRGEGRGDGSEGQQRVLINKYRYGVLVLRSYDKQHCDSPRQPKRKKKKKGLPARCGRRLETGDWRPETGDRGGRFLTHDGPSSSRTGANGSDSTEPHEKEQGTQ